MGPETQEEGAETSHELIPDEIAAISTTAGGQQKPWEMKEMKQQLSHFWRHSKIHLSMSSGSLQNL
jgi:hypothetical protein